MYLSERIDTYLIERNEYEFLTKLIIVDLGSAFIDRF